MPAHYPCCECETSLRTTQPAFDVRWAGRAGPARRGRTPPFASAAGTELDASNVRRAFRTVIKDADGLNATEWTPRELRHSFVSLLSDNGIPLEEISRLVGHSSMATTEAVYRKQIRPVVQTGAVAMDRIFS
ncbi:tyrosine-type recombinase/integrase [Nonomuraea rubra]|uniref:tyrosine-type recombinase/integrase n=1 Tax=Nonomuraea rubra TaxID=46180 RepID=UPI0033DCD2DE